MRLGGRHARKMLFALWVGAFVIALAVIVSARQPAAAFGALQRHAPGLTAPNLVLLKSTNPMKSDEPSDLD